MQKNNKNSHMHSCGSHLALCFSFWSFTLPPASQFFFDLPWQWEQSWHGQLVGLGMGCTSIPSEWHHYHPIGPGFSSLEWEGDILRQACTAASIRGLKP